MPRHAKLAEAPGQDSFLDIVANLVGILIILIMVIGAQAKKALVEAAPHGEPAAMEEADIDVSAPQAAADALQSDLNSLEAKLRQQQFEVAYRRQERNNIHLAITAVEEHLQQLRGGLSDAQRQQLDVQSAIAAAEQQLQTLNDARRAAENTVSPPGVIEHLPTPMAKTVFGKEMHFRLSGGRVTYVPMDELVERLKAEAPEKLWKLKDADQLTETIGPLEGFWLKYTLARTQYTQPVRGGAATQTRVELDHFTLVPVSDDLGEALPAALEAGSRFRAMVDGLDPKRTTLTLWVYPDSFDQFRELKRFLFQRGLLTAGRPMPEGMPIGGSPDGSRSVAQ